MRRLFVSLVALGLLAGLAAGPVSAAPPPKSPKPSLVTTACLAGDQMIVRSAWSNQVIDQGASLAVTWTFKGTGLPASPVSQTFIGSYADPSFVESRLNRFVGQIDWNSWSSLGTAVTGAFADTAATIKKPRTGWPICALPDLIISDISLGGGAQPYSYMVTIGNAGTATADLSGVVVQGYWSPDGTTFDPDLQSPAGGTSFNNGTTLATGGSTTIVVGNSTIPTAGLSAIGVKVDMVNSVSELLETNNVAFLALPCQYTPGSSGCVELHDVVLPIGTTGTGPTSTTLDGMFTFGSLTDWPVWSGGSTPVVTGSGTWVASTGASGTWMATRTSSIYPGQFSSVSGPAPCGAADTNYVGVHFDVYQGATLVGDIEIQVRVASTGTNFVIYQGFTVSPSGEPWGIHTTTDMSGVTLRCTAPA